MNRGIAFACLLAALSLDARAAGGGPAQGTLVAGQGLDWQRSGTELLSLTTPTGPPSPTPTFPPNNTFEVNAAKLSISTGCAKVSDFAWRCPVAAELARPAHPNHSQLCGRWLSEKSTTLWMYVLNGKPDGTGTFTFKQGAPDVFFACSVEKPADPPQEEEWAVLGAVGKCLLWPRPGSQGFLPWSKDDGREFNACVRALRADYCGNGITHTKDGTLIELYPSRSTHTLRRNFFLEANWDERGALCVIHARYVSLSPQCASRFSVVLGQPPHTLQSRTDFTGTEYHCDPRARAKQTGDCAKDREMAIEALRGGVLADDSMLQ